MRGNVNDYLAEISTRGGQAISENTADNVVYGHIDNAYTAHESSNSSDEMGEYYLFVAELKL